jgi:hypothetical protein
VAKPSLMALKRMTIAMIAAACCVRERFFTPWLRMSSYEELNAWLLDQCIAYARSSPAFGDAREDHLASI